MGGHRAGRGVAQVAGIAVFSLVLFACAGWGGAFPLSGGDAAAEAGTTDNAGRLLVYKLGGQAKLPIHEAVARRLTALPAALARPPDVDAVARGKATYHEWCMVCDGAGAVSGGVLPDLRKSEPEIYGALEEIVLRGAFLGNGMPRCDRWLGPEDVAAIRSYLIDRRAALMAASAAKP